MLCVLPSTSQRTATSISPSLAMSPATQVMPHTATHLLMHACCTAFVAGGMAGVAMLHALPFHRPAHAQVPDRHGFHDIGKCHACMPLHCCATAERLSCIFTTTIIMGVRLVSAEVVHACIADMAESGVMGSGSEDSAAAPPAVADAPAAMPDTPTQIAQAAGGIFFYCSISRLAVTGSQQAPIYSLPCPSEPCSPWPACSISP